MKSLSDLAQEFAIWVEQTEKIGDTPDANRDELLTTLYGQMNKHSKLVGSNPLVFKDANNLINKLHKLIEEKESEIKKLKEDCYLYEFNVGTHFYPGCNHPTRPGGFAFTSDCKYCTCWMGSSRSDDSSKRGINPFGLCPGNPKAKDELLKLNK